MKEIMTMSRNKAAECQLDKPWAAIQISTHEDWWPRLNCGNLKRFHRLFFDDLDRAIPGEDINLFTTAQAEAVLDFVKEVWDDIDILVVHCEAGISRSTGMAAALSRIHLGHDGNWFETATPNRHVYRMMLETAFNRGEYGVERAEQIEVPESKELSWDNDPTF